MMDNRIAEYELLKANNGFYAIKISSGNHQLFNPKTGEHKYIFSNCVHDITSKTVRISNARYTIIHRGTLPFKYLGLGLTEMMFKLHPEIFI